MRMPAASMGEHAGITNAPATGFVAPRRRSLVSKCLLFGLLMGCGPSQPSYPKYPQSWTKPRRIVVASRDSIMELTALPDTEYRCIRTLEPGRFEGRLYDACVWWHRSPGRDGFLFRDTTPAGYVLASGMRLRGGRQRFDSVARVFVGHFGSPHACLSKSSHETRFAIDVWLMWAGPPDLTAQLRLEASRDGAVPPDSLVEAQIARTGLQCGEWLIAGGPL